MKRSYKIIFSICAVLMFAFSFFAINFQPLFSMADSLNPTYDVSFISPDNSILFTTSHVPAGSSLQSLQDSNLLLNSEFIDLTGDVADNWTVSSNISSYGTVSFSSDSCTCTCQTDTPHLTTFLYQRVSVSQFVGSIITGSLIVNTINNDRNYATRFNIIFRNSSSNYIDEIYVNINSSGLYTLTGQIPSNTFFVDFCLGMTSNNVSGDSFTFSCPKLEIGAYTPYFSTNMVNQLLSSFNDTENFYSYSFNPSLLINEDLYYFPYNTSKPFSSFGIFQYATWSIVNSSDYSLVLNNFTGRFSLDYFDTYNNGFIIGSDLFHLVDDYFFEHDDIEGVFKIDFDNLISINQFNSFVTYNFQFGNNIYFYLDNGMVLYYDYSDLLSGINLSNYTNFFISSIVITFGSSWGDYGQFGLSTNSLYVNAYNNGYNDGFSDGRSSGYYFGYNNGRSNGYSDGYSKGLEDAGDYSFFSLISSVIDAPIKTITGLFNFELLGVNLLNLFTGLLTLALLLFILKLVLGGK